MSTSKRQLIFFLSLFTTFSLVSLTSPILYTYFNTYNQEFIAGVINPIYFTLALIFFSLIIGLFRFIFYRKYLIKNTVLAKGNSNFITLSDRIWFYSFIGIIHLTTSFRIIKNIKTFIISIIIILITIILIEVLLRLSINTLKVNFLDTGIVMSGYDIRISNSLQGLSSVVRNDYGYYRYRDIDSYYLYSDYMELFLQREQGSIKIFDDNNNLRKFEAIILQQNIEMKKNI